MSTPISIRPFRATDGARLIEVMAGTFAEYGMRFDPDGFDRDVREVEARYASPGAAFWAAVDDRGRALGFVGADVHSGDTPDPGPRAGEVELHRLYIDAEARGHGLGGRLVDTVEAWARGRGASGVALWSDVRFVHAHALYARRGYAVCRQRTIADPDRSVELGFRRDLAAPVAPAFPVGAALREEPIDGDDRRHRARMVAAAIIDSRSIVRAGRVAGGGHVLPEPEELFPGGAGEVAVLVAPGDIVAGLARGRVRRLHSLFDK